MPTMIKYAVIIIIVLSTSLVLGFSGHSFLRFSKPQKPRKYFGSNLIVLDDSWSEDVEWYASWPVDVTIILIGKQSQMKLKRYHCSIDQLNKEDKIKGGRLCFKTEGKDNCKKFETSQPRIEGFIAVTSNGDVQASVTLNETTGITGNFNYPLQRELDKRDLNADVYCSLHNARGEIRSNALHILDYRLGIQKPKYEKLKEMSTNKPVMLNCKFPKARVPMQSLRFTWLVCNRIWGSYCIGRDPIIATHEWPIQLFTNGSLYISFFPTKVQKKLKRKYLACVINEELAVVYNPITFLSGKDDDVEPTARFEDIEDKKRDVEIRQIHYKRLSCPVVVGSANFTKTWLKFENEKWIKIPQTPSVSISNYADLIIRHPFDKDTPGRYQCLVKFESTDQSNYTKRISLEFNVVVILPPKTASTVVPTIFVIDGRNATAICDFQGVYPHSEKNKVIPSLLINGEFVTGKFKRAVKNINKKFSKTMLPLSVSIKPRIGETLTYEYTAINMVYGPIKSTSHMVTCEGQAMGGSVLKDTLIKVFPRLVMSTTPSETNITECTTRDKCVFKCIVDNMADYENTVPRPMLHKYWKLGNKVLQKSNELHNISKDNSTLTILKPNTPDNGSAMEQEVLTCYIALGYPPSMQAPQHLKGQRLFYVANTDPQIRHKLSTTIYLFGPSKNKASQMLTYMYYPLFMALSILVFLS